MTKIAFIGTGNMGGALILGLLRAKLYDVYVYDLDSNKAKQFEAKGATLCSSIEYAAENADFLILTVKPNVYPSVLQTLAKLNYSKKLITVAPGITTSFVKSILPNASVVRTMPNTPALVGEGITLVADGEDKALVSSVCDILNCVGKTAVLAEDLLEAGTALSGSSPAIVYKLIEVMAESALSYGIGKKQAVEIAAQTVLGSAKMVLETKKHPCELIDNVCSPGGTTITAMNELAVQGFDKAVLKSMERCVDKTKSMRK